MVLSDDDIAKIQALFKSEFGKTLSKEDAYETGVKLLRLMSLTYKPMTEDEFAQIQERRKASISSLENKLKDSQ
jgi:hypothetical protein